MSRLAQVLVLTRDLPRAMRFYGATGVGLAVLQRTETWAEFAMAQNADDARVPRLAIKTADNEAALTTGYNPFLNFAVSDFDATLQRLLGLGATMDGPVKFPVHGKVASLRSPDGHMIGLFEAEGSSRAT